jgi:hypothetical protein
MALTTVQAGLIGNSQTIPSGINVGVPIIENPTTITSSYCISTGSNAHSVGTMTIVSGVTVTVPVGSVWSII